MDVNLKQDIIDEYNNILADKESNYINKIRLGYIEDNCNIMLLSMMIHCVENINIFNKKQLNSINHIINKVSNG